MEESKNEVTSWLKDTRGKQDSREVLFDHAGTSPAKPKKGGPG